MTSKRAARKDRRPRARKRAQGFRAGTGHLEQLIGEYVDELHLFGPAEFEQKVEESRRAVAAAGLKVPDWQVRRFAEREWSIASTPPPAPLQVSSSDPAAELRRPIIKGSAVSVGPVGTPPGDPQFVDLGWLSDDGLTRVHIPAEVDIDVPSLAVDGRTVTVKIAGRAAAPALLDLYSGGSVTSRSIGLPAVVAELLDQLTDGGADPAVVLAAVGARGVPGDGVMHPIARHVARRTGALAFIAGHLLVVERAGVTVRVELPGPLVDLVDQLDMFPDRYPSLVIDTYGGLL